MYRSRSLRVGLAGLAVVVAVAASTPAFAATKFWVASGGAKSWSTATNWSPVGVPGITDDVVLSNTMSNNDVMIDADVDIASLTVQSGYAKDIGPTGAQTIRIRGNVSYAGAAGFSLTASIAQIDGNLTVTSGELRAGAGTLLIGGNVTIADQLSASSGPVTISGTLNISGSGRYDAGSGPLVVGAMALSGGRFNGGSSATGTVTVTGNVALSGAHIFTANSNAAATIKIGGNYSQTGTSTFSASAAPRKIAGNFSLSGGTFTASSTITAIGGAFSRTGGTFAANAGTVIFDASSTPSSSHTLGSSTFATVKVSDGLVGYWSMDEGTGTTATDYGTGASNATFTNTAGAPWITTALPGAITFQNPAAGSLDGVNDYVDIASAVIATDDSFSSCGWVKLNARATGGVADSQTLLSVDPQTSPAGTQVAGFALQYRGDLGGVFGFSMAQSNSTSATQDSVYATALGTPTAGSWYHLCAIYDASTTNMNLYVNGTSYGPTTHATTWNATGHAIIGSDWSGTRQHYLNGRVDDVRFYDRALSGTEVSALFAGSRPAGATHTFSDAFTTTTGFLVVEGTVVNGAATQTMSNGLSVYPNGVLTLSAAGTLAVAGTRTLTIDGTLNASNTSATISAVSGNYAFKVGSTAWARPTLNISGLRVQNTDTNGMWINASTSAVTRFTRFDNIAFSAGTGAQLLQIYSNALYLASSGCTFDAGVTATTTNSVRLTGNGTADGETRAMFGGSTCASSVASCQASKIDDDANNDGVGDPTPSGNEAVVQFVRGAGTDTSGTVEGFPTAAFDWNTFAYYSTYVAFHDVSGTVDRVYVRTQTGGAEYSWDTPSGEQIVGTPRWNTTGTTHYLFVATASGKVYRLIDNGTSLVQDNSGSWAGAANPFDCGCTIVTPLTINATNLYWGGIKTSPVAQMIWTVSQTTQAQPVGSPFTITPTITSAAPALFFDGTNYLIIGLTGNLIKLNVSNQTLTATNTSPGSASVVGRLTATQTRIYAADNGGNVWSFDANNFAGTNRMWQHTVGGGDQIQGSILLDQVGGIIHFGTEQGKVGAVSSTTGATQTGYPFVPGSTSDAIRTAPLYINGILVVGTTTGKLYFYDRNNGTTGPAFIKQYAFGPTQAVSGVGYDSNAQRYMVSVADPTTKDGRVYFIDAITDPTAAK